MFTFAGAHFVPATVKLIIKRAACPAIPYPLAKTFVAIVFSGSVEERSIVAIWVVKVDTSCLLGYQSAK